MKKINKKIIGLFFALSFLAIFATVDLKQANAQACGEYKDFAECERFTDKSYCCGSICTEDPACWVKSPDPDPETPKDPNPATRPEITPPTTPTPTPAGPNPCEDKVNYEYLNGLCIPKSQFSANSLAGTKSLAELILRVLKYLLILSGMIAVVAMVIGGFWYITAGGNEEQAEKGQKAITNAIIGLVVVILAYAIINIVTETLTTDNLVQTVNERK